MRIHTANERITNQAPYTIYALTEPGETDVLVVARIRYIGKTKNLDQRFRDHLSDARRGIRRYCYSWIRELLAVGLVPNLEVLCNMGTLDACRAEQETIARFRLLGAPLTNLTDGGEGTPGRIVSPETRAKISAANRGNKTWLGRHHSDKTKRKISAVQMGKKLSPESIAKRTLASTGRKHSAETRARMSAAQMGNKKRLGQHPSEETRARIGAAQMGNKKHLGHHHSDGAKLKISIANMGKRLGSHHSEETRAKMSAARRIYLATKED